MAPRASRTAGLGVHLLHARIGVRQHLHIDAGGIHLGDAALTDIVEAFGDPRRMLRVSTGIMPLYLGIEVMLLQRDDIRLRRHLSPPTDTGSCLRFLAGEGKAVIGRKNGRRGGSSQEPADKLVDPFGLFDLRQVAAARQRDEPRLCHRLREYLGHWRLPG